MNFNIRFTSAAAGLRLHKRAAASGVIALSLLLSGFALAAGTQAGGITFAYHGTRTYFGAYKVNSNFSGTSGFAIDPGGAVPSATSNVSWQQVSPWPSPDANRMKTGWTQSIPPSMSAVSWLLNKDAENSRQFPNATFRLAAASLALRSLQNQSFNGVGINFAAAPSAVANYAKAMLADANAHAGLTIANGGFQLKWIKTVPTRAAANSKQTVTIQLNDSLGQPVSNVALRLNINGSGNLALTTLATPVTGRNGQASWTFRIAKAGRMNLSVQNFDRLPSSQYPVVLTPIGMPNASRVVLLTPGNGVTSPDSTFGPTTTSSTSTTKPVVTCGPCGCQPCPPPPTTTTPTTNQTTTTDPATTTTAATLPDETTTTDR